MSSQPPELLHAIARACVRAGRRAWLNASHGPGHECWRDGLFGLEFVDRPCPNKPDPAQESCECGSYTKYGHDVLPVQGIIELRTSYARATHELRTSYVASYVAGLYGVLHKKHRKLLSPYKNLFDIFLMSNTARNSWRWSSEAVLCNSAKKNTSWSARSACVARA
jgi:hypothetical protein